MKRIVVLAIVLSALLVSPASAFRDRGFHTPNGNIGCEMFAGPGTGGGAARCDIAKRNWKAPPPPPSCKLDYGNGLIVLRHGRGRYTCAGDTALHQGHKLKKGRSVKVGKFRCRSLGKSVRCVNKKNGHGFRISRKHAKRF